MAEKTSQNGQGLVGKFLVNLPIKFTPYSRSPAAIYRKNPKHYFFCDFLGKSLLSLTSIPLKGGVTYYFLIHHVPPIMALSRSLEVLKTSLLYETPPAYVGVRDTLTGSVVPHPDHRR